MSLPFRDGMEHSSRYCYIVNDSQIQIQLGLLRIVRQKLNGMIEKWKKTIQSAKCQGKGTN